MVDFISSVIGIIGFAIGIIIGLIIVAGIVYSILYLITKNKTISVSIASVAVILLNIKLLTQAENDGIQRKALVLTLIISILSSLGCIFESKEEEKKDKEKEYNTITANDLKKIKQDNYLEPINNQEELPSNSNGDNNLKP